MKKVALFIALISGVLSGGGYLFASVFSDHVHKSGIEIDHSGRTDSNGCHTNRKTGIYHCH